jgi:hypothetical protein
MASRPWSTYAQTYLDRESFTYQLMPEDVDINLTLLDSYAIDNGYDVDTREIEPWLDGHRNARYVHVRYWRYFG